MFFSLSQAGVESRFLNVSWPKQDIYMLGYEIKVKTVLLF